MKKKMVNNYTAQCCGLFGEATPTYRYPIYGDKDNPQLITGYFSTKHKIDIPKDGKIIAVEG